MSYTRNPELDQLVAERDADHRDGAATEHHGKLVDSFKERVLKKNTRGGLREVEIKSLNVSHHMTTPGITWVIIEVGSVGDERTAASLFCRDHRHIMIGRKGGVTLMNAQCFGREKKDGTFGKPRKRTKQLQGWHNAVHAPTD